MMNKGIMEKSCLMCDNFEVLSLSGVSYGVCTFFRVFPEKPNITTCDKFKPINMRRQSFDDREAEIKEMFEKYHYREVK